MFLVLEFVNIKTNNPLGVWETHIRGAFETEAEANAHVENVGPRKDHYGVNRTPDGYVKAVEVAAGETFPRDWF